MEESELDCNIHGGKRTAWRCRECKEYICEKCIEEEHSEHKYESLEDIGNVFITEIEETIGNINETIKLVEGEESPATSFNDPSPLSILIQLYQRFQKNMNWAIDSQIRKLKIVQAGVSEDDLPEMKKSKVFLSNMITNLTDLMHQDKLITLYKTKLGIESKKEYYKYCVGNEEERKEEELESTDIHKKVEWMDNIVSKFVKEFKDGAKSIQTISNLQDSNLTHFCQKNSPYIYMLNVDCKKCERITLKDKRLGTNYASIQIFDKIYISGGASNDTKENNLVQLDPDACDLVALSPMIYPRMRHKLVGVMRDRIKIYAIGGKWEEDYLTTCEKYDVEADEWELGPSLNEKKFDIAASAFSNAWIYVFGGYNGKQLSSVERLNLAEEGGGWKMLFISGIKPSQHYSAAQINKDQILLFGMTAVYVFIVNGGANETILTTKTMAKSASYIGETGSDICSKGNIYSINSKSGGDMHIYDVGEKVWTAIDKSQWEKWN